MNLEYLLYRSKSVARILRYFFLKFKFENNHKTQLHKIAKWNCVVICKRLTMKIFEVSVGHFTGALVHRSSQTSPGIMSITATKVLRLNLSPKIIFIISQTDLRNKFICECIQIRCFKFGKTAIILSCDDLHIFKLTIVLENGWLD